MKNSNDSTEGLDASIKNVVLVHGAFADGSGYKALYMALTKKGYRVTVVQNPSNLLRG